jgi:hypothetical protein
MTLLSPSCPGVPEGRVSLGHNLELRVRAIRDPAAPTGSALEVRLFRLFPDAPEAGYVPTRAAWRCGLERVPTLATLMIQVARKACVASVYARDGKTPPDVR